MNATTAYRLPTGELVFAASPSLSLADFFGFMTAFVVSLSALAIASIV